MKKKYYIIGGLGLAAIATLIYAKTASTVNAVKGLTFGVNWYGDLNDINISTSGVKLPLSAVIGNRSDQTVKGTINSVDIYKGGSKIAYSKAKKYDFVLSSYRDTTIPIDIVIPYLSALSLIRSYGSLYEAFSGIKIRIDFTLNGSLQQPIVIDVETGEVSLDGVGYTPTLTRNIRSLSNYGSVIPRYTNNKHTDPILIENVTPEQTASFIRKMAKSCAWQTKELSKRLKRNTVKETVRSVFDFVFNHIEYVRDSEKNEQVRSPLRTLEEQKGDCDCFSLLIASIFENLNIPYIIRIAEYDHKGYFQHVYVIAMQNGQELPCDPVTDYCFYQKPFTNKKDF
ncbi:MAG: transglutaminase-like domain-containing protein [Paludibacteraceae bacterium]|nr:transglutaminase-like domain-containing protein [Paludibacteraceae bacterium]